MKVTLINPPQDQLANPRAYIPLGLAYIGAVLENEGHHVDALDMSENPEHVRIPESDVYGLSCATATYDAALEVRKKLDESKLIVVGGIHPSIAPDETLADFRCDHVIAGEGEYAFRDLLRDPERGAPVIYAENIRNLDDLPLPARHLFTNVVDYTGIHGQERGEGATTIISSRGCPFNCAFCTRIPQTRDVRFRSAHGIINEMKRVMEEYPVTHFRFVDDIFTVNRARTMKFCDLMLSEWVGATWICITRADALDAPLTDKMKLAGCTEIHIGVESGSQRVLNLMNKKTDIKTLETAIQIIKHSGIKVKTYIMYGFPGETEADRKDTVNFIRRTQPDKVTISYFTNIRGSATWSTCPHGRNWFYPDNDGDYQSFRDMIYDIIGD